MAVKVTGAKELRRTLSGANVHGVVVAASRAGAIKAKGLAERPGFGFTDRTGRLRRSVRIEQARDQRGRFTAAFRLTSNVYYAPFVEHKRRTRDRRRGPPYWYGRLTRDPYRRQIEDAMATAALKEIDARFARGTA